MYNEKRKSKWSSVIKVLIILFILSFIVSWMISLFIDDDFKQGNVAIIPIDGVIMPGNSNMFGQDIVSSKEIVSFIEEADKNLMIKAIVFEINSPGGAAVSTEEIVSAIQKVNKTTVAYIREVGASGGYWIAASTDYIFASRMSITGSVGVIASYLEFSGLLDDYNVTYQRLVAGKYKDIGSPLKQMSWDEESILQKEIDLIHEYFIEDISKSRNLSEREIKEIETARIFLGIEAKEIGLIDEFGGKDEALSYVEQRLNITAEPTEYARERTFMDLLSGLMSKNSFFVGKGIGSSLLEAKQTNGIRVWT
ncbi:MAG: signal peptide peptidase SppA [Nanoarchaeota archaeon]|nr:signal peptide peptidase SppA [Nanoarchaeota archaeon]MBU1946034.1 signal peptide peptidase SppA [Nanoarchaeota archaeon]